jgi:hypothetical protein
VANKDIHTFNEAIKNSSDFSERGRFNSLIKEREQIIVKTDKDGRATFHMEMFVLERDLRCASYSVEFAHNLISDPVIKLVNGNTFEKAIRKKSFSKKSSNASPNLNNAAKGDMGTVLPMADNSIRWFGEAELAAHLGEGFFTARKLYSLYKEYGRTILFIKHAVKVFAIDTIIGIVVIEAFFSYAEYQLKQYGYSVD